MEPTTTHRLRRVGRLARRRMRIEGDVLRNGIHTDGRLTVRISGLGLATAGTPETFEWTADRPIALVIVRSGIDGDDVSFQVGPLEAGSGIGAQVSDGAGIRYIAFCYDAAPDPVTVAIPSIAVAALPPAAPAAPRPAAPAAPRPIPPVHPAIAPARRVVAAILGDRPAALPGSLRAGATA